MLTIKYNASALTPAGFRSVTITAHAEQISEKRAQIAQVLDVDGHGASGYASRTGANRQRFNVGYVAGAELGKTKNLSAVTIVE